MTADELKVQVLGDIDAVLNAPWIVQKFLRSEHRRRLNAMRRFWLGDDGTQTVKLLTLLNQEPLVKESAMAFELHHYPDSPYPAVQTLLAKWRGEDIPVNEMIHACWHLVGSGLSVYDPHPLVVGDTLLDDAGILASMAPCLQAIEAADPDSKNVTGAIDWGMLAILAIQLLLKLLKK